MLSFHEKYVLLTINDEKGNVVNAYAKTYGFAGAIIMELVEKDIITVQDKKIIFNRETAKSTILSDALTILLPKKKKLKLGTALHYLGDKFYKKFDDVLDNLVDKGILTKKEDKILWIFTTRKFPTENPEPENTIKSKIKGAVLYGNRPDQEIRNLIALVHTLNLYNEIFSKEERKKARKSIKKIVKEKNISNDIQAVIQQEITAAITLLISASTVATTAATS